MATLLMGVSGCTAPEQPQPRTGMTARPGIARVPAPLPMAHCEIEVEGIGVVDMEEDYLPHVIACENGGAGLEALEAQAIAARSVAYYAIETAGSICDSHGCQVYSCANTPGAIHYQAVDQTRGRYLMYNQTLTYGFYVAGDSGVQPPACVGNPNVGTEHWVTYNEGKSGTDVTQTELGFVHDPGDPGYGQNRGCMSQWGARCLENGVGYDAEAILRFYYGDDIVIAQARGECVVMGTSSSDGGDPSVGTSGGPGDPSGTGPATTTSTSGETAEGGSTTSGDVGGTGEVTWGLPDTFGVAEGEDGCGCGVTNASGSSPWWGIALVGFARGRARRRPPGSAQTDGDRRRLPS